MTRFTDFLQLALPLVSRARPQRPTGGSRPRFAPVGDTLDLREVSARLVDEYFEGSLEVDITWGRRRGRRRSVARRRRSIRLGSFRYDTRLIRIHRVLDQAEIPCLVVEAIVHHELVHAALPEPVALPGGRRAIHTAEFRRLERRYAFHREAEAWLAKNLERLLLPLG